MAVPEKQPGNVSGGQTYCIFVCGATAKSDVWMLADFMATSKIFIRTGGINGSYLNTWTVDEYLEDNLHVAWGYEGANVGTPLVVYNRDETAWWQQIPCSAHKDLPGIILRELKKTAENMEVSDTVDLFFFGHGSERAWLEIGAGHELSRTVLDEIIARDFKIGVQINIIVAACYTGQMLEMIESPNKRRRMVQISAAAVEKSWFNTKIGASTHWRGSPITTTYTSSLILGLKTAQKTIPKRTLEQHINYANYQQVESNLYYFQNCHEGDTQCVLDAVLNLFLRSYTVHSLRGGEKAKHGVFTPSNPGPKLKPQNHSSAADSASTRRGDHLADRIENEVLRIRRRPGATVEQACSNSDKEFFTYRYKLTRSRDPRELLDLFEGLLSGL